MRTMVFLLMVLLTLGLGSLPAMAGDQAVMQPLPAACQPVSDAELCQLNGRFAAFANTDLGRLAMCVYNKLPAETQANLLRAHQVAKTVYTRIHGAPAAPAAGVPPVESLPAAAAVPVLSSTPAAASVPAAAAALAAAGLRLR